MGILSQIKDMVKLQDDYNNSLLASAVASEKSAILNKAMSCVGRYISSQEVKNAVSENMQGLLKDALVDMPWYHFSLWTWIITRALLERSRAVTIIKFWLYHLNLQFYSGKNIRPFAGRQYMYRRT